MTRQEDKKIEYLTLHVFELHGAVPSCHHTQDSLVAEAARWQTYAMPRYEARQEILCATDEKSRRVRAMAAS